MSIENSLSQAYFIEALDRAFELTWAVAFVAVIDAVELAVATIRHVKAQVAISAPEPDGTVTPLPRPNGK